MAKPARIAGLKSLRSREDSLIFRNHVPATTINHDRQHMFPGFQIGDRNVAQRADSRQVGLQEFHPLLAVRSAAVVFSRSQFVSYHAVAYHQPEIMRQRQQLIFKGAAIEHQRMPSGAVNGDELVHDPAACADEFVFRLLAKLRQFQTRNINSGE